MKFYNPFLLAAFVAAGSIFTSCSDDNNDGPVVDELSVKGKSSHCAQEFKILMAQVICCKVDFWFRLSTFIT